MQDEITILVIDDDPGDVHLIRRLAEQVEDWPVEIVASESAEDAIDLLAKRSVDVILLDYRLGAESGLKLLKELATAGDRCRAVIMVTGQGDEEIAAEAMKSGALDYISKARLSPKVLYDSIYSALENSDLRRQMEIRRDELLRLANFDELTGLRNRRSFMEWLENEFKRSKRYSSPLCIMMLDVDEFKQVNDNYGHLSGDQLLASIGSAIASMLRSTDAAGRLGGDEFCIAVIEQQIEGTRLFAERLRSTLEATSSVRNQEGDHRVTCSIGIAAFEPSMTTPEQILERADQSLYRSKAEGRNRVSVWSSLDAGATSLPTNVPEQESCHRLLRDASTE